MIPIRPNTRAVAALKWPATTDCTQPVSISMVRACLVLGRGPTGTLGGIFDLSGSGKAKRTSRPRITARRNRPGLVLSRRIAPRCSRSAHGRPTVSAIAAWPMS